MRKFISLILKMILFFILVFFLISFISIFIELLKGLIFEKSDKLQDNIIVLQLVQFFAFVTPVFIIRMIFKDKSRWPLGLKYVKWGQSLLKGMFIGFVLIIFSFLFILLFKGLYIHSVNLNNDTFNQLILGVFIFFIVAINEELMLRGYIQGLVKYEYGTKSAIITSSIVFALLHGINPGVWENPIPLINLFCAGMILGALREQQGGLWTCIGFHFSWNFIQGSVLGFNVSGQETDSVLNISLNQSVYINGGTFGAEGSILTLVLLIGYLIWIFKRV